MDDPLDAMQATDLLSFLPGNLLAYGDAMSMMHALELRLPLLDHRLIELVQALSAGCRFASGKKTLLKAAARKLLPPGFRLKLVKGRGIAGICLIRFRELRPRGWPAAWTSNKASASCG